MVSYYNNLAMYTKNEMPYPPFTTAHNRWYQHHFHQGLNHQYMGESEPISQPMYYHTHPMFHQSSPDWSGHDNFSAAPQHVGSGGGNGGGGGGGGGDGLHHSQSGMHGPNGIGGGSGGGVGIGNGHDHLPDGINSIPSPPITVSGSEMSSPGAPNGSSSPQTAAVRPPPTKSPFEWMKKPSYQNQVNPGKTRTKDKYRVVYTDFQRLELEKEYHTARYITIRRKTELAQNLQLSERQVKIWFQNRRAKERKQTKKRDDTIPNGGNGVGVNTGQQHNHQSNLSNMLLDAKPKIEPSLHLHNHALHQMNAMSMGMSSMGLHHHSLHHGHLGVPPPPPTVAQHLHQNGGGQQGPTGSLSI